MGKHKNKIYTRTGDMGETGLVGGQRVQKNDHRIEAYGTVDELNSFLGLCKASLDGGQCEKILTELTEIQKDLFSVGAQLSAYPEGAKRISASCLKDGRIKALEESMDDLDAVLPPLKGFILPCGHPAAAWSHVCRTVCRRAERSVVNMKVSCPAASLEAEKTVYRIIRYLNRLSDYFFILARYLNATHTHEEELWLPWQIDDGNESP